MTDANLRPRTRKQPSANELILMIGAGSLHLIAARLKATALLTIAQVQLAADFCNFSGTYSELRSQFQDYWADFKATTHTLTTTPLKALGDSLHAQYIIGYDEKRAGRHEFRVSLKFGYTQSKFMVIDVLRMHKLLDIAGSTSFTDVVHHIPGLGGFSVKRCCLQTHKLLFVRQTTWRARGCNMGLYLTKTACARLERFVIDTQDVRERLLRDAAYANMHLMATCNAVSSRIRQMCPSCPEHNALMLPNDTSEDSLLDVYRRVRAHPCVFNTHTVALQVDRYIESNFADRQLDTRFTYRAFVEGTRARVRRELAIRVRYEVMASMHIP